MTSRPLKVTNTKLQTHWVATDMVGSTHLYIHICTDAEESSYWPFLLTRCPLTMICHPTLLPILPSSPPPRTPPLENTPAPDLGLDFDSELRTEIITVQFMCIQFLKLPLPEPLLEGEIFGSAPPLESSGRVSITNGKKRQVKVWRSSWPFYQGNGWNLFHIRPQLWQFGDKIRGSDRRTCSNACMFVSSYINLSLVRLGAHTVKDNGHKIDIYDGPVADCG